MDLGLTGKTAVVTGASKGIGLATARCFLEEGARVAICARHEEALEQAAKELSSLGEVMTFCGDMTRQEDVDALAEKALTRFGRVDCWINNVGASIRRAGRDYTPDEIRRTVDVCFTSAVYGCQAAGRVLGRGGVIVNISSLAARCGTAGRSTLYGPLKAAVSHLAVMFAAEYASRGIRAVSVLPGFTITPAVRVGIAPEELRRNEAGTLLQRMADPAEIARPIVFLCSDAASYITATSLEVSGGRSVILNPEFVTEGNDAG